MNKMITVAILFILKGCLIIHDAKAVHIHKEKDMIVKDNEKVVQVITVQGDDKDQIKEDKGTVEENREVVKDEKEAVEENTEAVKEDEQAVQEDVTTEQKERENLGRKNMELGTIVLKRMTQTKKSDITTEQNPMQTEIKTKETEQETNMTEKNMRNEADAIFNVSNIWSIEFIMSMVACFILLGAGCVILHSYIRIDDMGGKLDSKLDSTEETKQIHANLDILLP
ncbi:unnamed protein product [Owenia fusiformis]|uniref:Uncharacterized protein n=1 Tax=Owenia fusiformis TaxID=6347 RepID=A0A8J1TC83_OWEFU|nr:unnamed protein product [Owenia fusiformis]